MRRVAREEEGRRSPEDEGTVVAFVAGRTRIVGGIIREIEGVRPVDVGSRVGSMCGGPGAVCAWVCVRVRVMLC